MAETFLFSIAGKLLGDMGSQALQEIKLLCGYGAKDKLQKLKNTVSTIEAVNAEQKQSTNHQVQDWLRKLEVELYEADDLNDDISTQVLRHSLTHNNKNMAAKKVCIFFSSSNQLAFRLKIGHKVKAIRKWLQAISEDRHMFHFSEWLVELGVENKRREETHSFVLVEEVVGREKEVSAIIELLFDARVKENVPFISIVGIGGIGKTTLAQLVYNGEQVKHHFDLRMWVCVSNVFDVKIIAHNIAESSAKNKLKRFQMDGVMDELRKQIDGNKYLLVVDDVWNEDPVMWLKLRELLMGGERGSKVLVTTRTQLVTKITSTLPPYLEGSTESSSRSLLKKITFDHQVEPVNQTMVAIGQEILKNCVGVPLAIKTIGGLLNINDVENVRTRIYKLSK